MKSATCQGKRRTRRGSRRTAAAPTAGEERSVTRIPRCVLRPRCYFFFGWYQWSSPFWSRFVACSGVIFPFSTAALVCQSSFSRFGVPRDRIWYELRIVVLHVFRQDTNVLASGSVVGIGADWSEKKPGSELE